MTNSSPKSKPSSNLQKPKFSAHIKEFTSSPDSQLGCPDLCRASWSCPVWDYSTPSWTESSPETVWMSVTCAHCRHQPPRRPRHWGGCWGWGVAPPGCWGWSWLCRGCCHHNRVWATGSLSSSLSSSHQSPADHGTSHGWIKHHQLSWGSRFKNLILTLISLEWEE